MIVAVSGSRTITDVDAIKKALRSLPDKITQIRCGDAETGADPVVTALARERSIDLKIVSPDWTRYKRGAAFKANDEILDTADMALAVYDGKSSGTGDFIKKAKKMKKVLKVITL